MSTSAIRIVSYYRRLHAYLHGTGSDPGGFSKGIAYSESPEQFVAVNNLIVPTQYRRLSERLSDIVAKNSSLIQNIIVHGSYGDFTNNSFSDLDIILYLRQSVLESRRKRQQLQRLIKTRLMAWIYSIDPLQHHGFFLLWPALCDCYAQSILPLVIYGRAWSVKDFRVCFRCVDPSALPRTPALIRTIFKEYSRLAGLINFYCLKRLLSHVMMVPCIHYVDQNTYLHKSASFEPFMQEYPKSRQLLAAVTEMRDKWPQKPRVIDLLEFKNIGYRMFGRRYPWICGAFYRSSQIKRNVRKLPMTSLLEVVR